MELKNSNLTDNSSSRKENLNKLRQMKNQYPDYNLIYACVNDVRPKAFLMGDIHYLSKDYLFQYVLGIGYKCIIERVKSLVEEFISF